MNATVDFTDADVEVRGADDPPVIRLFRPAGAAYDLPDEAYRNGRFDPPPGYKKLFAMLYTADNIAAAAMECRILQADSRNVSGLLMDSDWMKLLKDYPAIEPQPDDHPPASVSSTPTPAPAAADLKTT